MEIKETQVRDCGFGQVYAVEHDIMYQHIQWVSFASVYTGIEMEMCWCEMIM
jgi:hypothetical protein